MSIVAARASRLSNGPRAARVAALLVAAGLMGGCALGELLGRAEPSPSESEALDGQAILDGEGLAVYLDMMRQLVEGDPVTQAETFLAVAEAAARSPTTTNRTKLALAVATPGHPASDPADAQRRLSNLLASGSALLPEERMLVSIHLKEVEQRMILNAEARRLRAEATEARAAQDGENARRLEAALQENARLQRELEEAQQKLDAITNIERSIRERENGSDSQ